MLLLLQALVAIFWCVGEVFSCTFVIFSKFFIIFLPLCLYGFHVLSSYSFCGSFFRVVDRSCSCGYLGLVIFMIGYLLRMDCHNFTLGWRHASICIHFLFVPSNLLCRHFVVKLLPYDEFVFFYSPLLAWLCIVFFDGIRGLSHSDAS